MTANSSDADTGFSVEESRSRRAAGAIPVHVHARTDEGFYTSSRGEIGCNATIAHAVGSGLVRLRATRSPLRLCNRRSPRHLPHRHVASEIRALPQSNSRRLGERDGPCRRRASQAPQPGVRHDRRRASAPLPPGQGRRETRKAGFRTCTRGNRRRLVIASHAQERRPRVSRHGLATRRPRCPPPSSVAIVRGCARCVERDRVVSAIGYALGVS